MPWTALARDRGIGSLSGTPSTSSFTARQVCGPVWSPTCQHSTSWSRSKAELVRLIGTALGRRVLCLEDLLPEWRQRPTSWAHHADQQWKFEDLEGGQQPWQGCRPAPDSEESVLAIPCRLSPGGLILALPSQALDAETLEGGHEALEDDMVGPNVTVKVPALGTEEDEDLEVVLVEFDVKVRTLLEKKAPRTRKLYLGFAEDLKVMPSMTALDQKVEDWIQVGSMRREDYK